MTYQSAVSTECLNDFWHLTFVDLCPSDRWSVGQAFLPRKV